MRVVLDTSILVAALRSRLGASNGLLTLVVDGSCILLVMTAAFVGAAEPVGVHFTWRRTRNSCS